MVSLFALSGINLFLLGALVCTTGAILTVGLRGARVLKVSWGLTLLVVLALALTAWCCVEMAAYISRST
jgi:hypothetical protein